MDALLQTVVLPNGETIAFRKREGGEEVLLLIHGNMVSSYHWDVLFEKFPNRFTLVAPDLRGQGKSSYNKRINSLKDFAEDLYLFVNTLSLPSFHLVGWSMGGGVSMQFAASYPKYVKNLMLISSMSTRGYPLYKVNAFGKPIITKRLQTREEIRKDQARYIPLSKAYESKNTAFLEQVLNLTMYTVKKPHRKRYRAYLQDLLQQQNLLDVYDAMNKFNISHHHNGLVEGTKEVDYISAPTLILWGDQDVIVTKQMQEEIKADFNHQATYHELKNVGHSPLVDDYQSLEEAMLSFLNI